MRVINEGKIISLAEKLFVKFYENPMLTEDQIAKAALDAAEAFYKMVEQREREDINPVKNGFDRFDSLDPRHSEIYTKIEKFEGGISCNDDERNRFYLNHEYPDWVVCKALDRSGKLFGYSTEHLVFDGDGWVVKKDIAEWDRVQIMGELCSANPEESLVSIQLPF